VCVVPRRARSWVRYELGQQDLQISLVLAGLWRMAWLSVVWLQLQHRAGALLFLSPVSGPRNRRRHAAHVGAARITGNTFDGSHIHGPAGICARQIQCELTTKKKASSQLLKKQTSFPERSSTMRITDVEAIYIRMEDVKEQCDSGQDALVVKV